MQNQIDNTLIMQNQLDDLGLYLTDEQSKLFFKLVINYNLDCSSVQLYSSSGRSIVLKCTDIVYQFYLYKSLYDKVVENIKRVEFIPGIIHVYEFIPQYNTIVFECVEPIYNVVKNKIIVPREKLDTFFNDMFQIMFQLRLQKLVHGDFVCDNIGYSWYQNQYVVYDLEFLSAMTIDSVYRDVNEFNKSCRFHLI